MKESEKNNTHTDWQSASSWFGERQNDRINTSAGKYSERKVQEGRREAQRPNSSASPNRSGHTSSSAGRPAEKKTAGQQNIRTKVKTASSVSRKNRDSGKSKDELRLEYAEKTRKRRKRKIIEWFVFTALIFAAIFVAASLTVLFHIENISVEGDTRYTAEEIIEASNVKTGDNLWRTSTKTVSGNVSTKLPYVLNVKLQRKIPSGLTLVVKETSPAYAVRNSKRYTLIDEYDKVLEIKAKKTAGSLIIMGINVSDSQTEGHKLETELYENYSAAKNIFKSAEDNGIKLVKISVKDLNNISAVTSKKIRLDIGSSGQLDEKMKMAGEVIDKLTEENSLSEGAINLKSATKAFYKEGSSKITEATEENSKKSAQKTEGPSENENAESTLSAEESTSQPSGENQAESINEAPSETISSN